MTTVHKIAGFAQKNIEGSTLAALNNEAHRGPARDRYQVSKLINQFLAAEIALLPAASNIVVSTVNPGLCVSSLRRDIAKGFKA
jgi:NAD(P)-dependent dehydrogenase (short-subunit alcohol dehydrogenase family)